MIEASFEGMRERSAAVSGAYQYDTGQRLRLYGLPSPDELAMRDDFLSGDRVTVQAQYAYSGDGQTEMRLATYDESEGAWTAAVPDAYLTRSADVHVYIYVGYGQTEDGMRAKTCYEAVFRPMGRPAPGTEVTPDQLNAWDALVQEVNLAVAGADEAAAGANAAAATAREMANRLDGTTAEAVTLEPGSAATAEVMDKAGRKHIVIGVPKGEKGEKGNPGLFSINGHEASDNAEIKLTHEDVGAMPADHKTVFEFTATIPATWRPLGVPYVYMTSVAVEGVLATDRPVIDIDYGNPTEMEDILEAWGMIQSVTAGDGVITAICYMDMPAVAIPIRMLCVR